MSEARRQHPATRALLALVFIASGVIHLVAPQVYRGIMPPWLPVPDQLILVSGVAEILGGLGLLLVHWRRAAAVGLIVLLLAVFPANIQMLLNSISQHESWMRQTVLWLRLPLQPLLIWLVWRAGLAGPRAPGAVTR
jgi:uncharacterized membrane protein